MKMKLVVFDNLKFNDDKYDFLFYMYIYFICYFNIKIKKFKFILLCKIYKVYFVNFFYSISFLVI